MKGNILKTDDGWVIEYSDFVITSGKKGVLGGYRRTKVTKEIPLHPDDATLLNKSPQFNFIGDRVRFKQVKLNPLGREVEPLDLTQNQSGCVWYGKLIPEVEDKEEQKQHLIDIMKGDEELGLYDEENDWDKIFDEYYGQPKTSFISLNKWLKENYEIPKKKDGL